MAEKGKLTNEDKIRIAAEADKHAIKKKIECDRPRNITIPDMIAYVRNEYPEKMEAFKEKILEKDAEGKVKNTTLALRSYLYSEIVPESVKEEKEKAKAEKKSYRERILEELL